MQVYKAFFKIIQKNLGQIMIYIVIFMSLTLFLANTNNVAVKTDFTETRVNMAFINHDADSRLLEGLKGYLSENSNIVDVPDERQSLQDALFFRKVEYIVRVPEGFTEGFIKGNAPAIKKTTLPGSASGRYIDNLINKYLNTARSYLKSTEHLSEEQLLAYIDDDLSEKTDVVLDNTVEGTSIRERRAYYFNYMAYSLYAVLILGISAVMMVFNNTDLKRRNLCSPVKLKSINLQMILGSLTYAVLVWLILIFMSFVMYRSYMFTARGLLLILNSFIFTTAVLSISYLIGSVIKSKPAASAAVNIVALGTSFISGVFVPQELLGNTVLKIASFTPNYWYVKSNNSIVKIAEFNLESLRPIFLNMLIVIGFALAVLSVTMLLSKQKRMSN